MKTRQIGVKQIFAGLGAIYLMFFVGYLVYAGVKSTRPTGPSELLQATRSL